jgi:hypothetical protein
MSIRRASVVIFSAALLLNLRETAAQTATSDTPLIGSVNGQPLRASSDRAGAVTVFRIAHLRAPSSAADELEISDGLAKSQCQGITGTIAVAAQATQMSRLGMTAPPEEVKELKAAYLKAHDPEAEAKKVRDDATALIAALTEVYEHGMDPQQAYKRYLAPSGYPQAAWQGNLVPGSAPEWRAKWASRERITAKMIADGIDPSLTRLVERRHLDAAVDQQIASSDPTFRAYLDEERLGTVKNGIETHIRGIAAHGDYLRSKRAEWWQAREAEVQVVIYDPALAKQCAIGTATAIPAPQRRGGPPPGTPVPVTVAPINPQR